MSAIISDNFHDNKGWEKTGAYVNSSLAIADGKCTITRGTNYKTSSWTRPEIYGRNMILSADLDGYQRQALFNLREAASTDMLLVWVSSGRLKVNKLVANANTELSNVLMSDVSSANTYRLKTTIWENRLFVTVLDEDGVMKNQTIITSSDISDQVGKKHGLGVVGGGDQIWDNVLARPFLDYTNIVCLGDSNTNYNPYSDELETPWQIHKRKELEGFTCVNSGISGNRVAQITARLGADLDPYLVTGARNICTIFAGTNNFSDGDTPAQVWAELDTLITTTVAAGWDTYVLTYPHSFAARDADLDDLRDLVIANASGLGATVIDFFTDMGCTTGNHDLNTEYTKDGDRLHLNPAGRAFAARTIINAFPHSHCGRQSL